jgi:hypothetical protein
MNYSQKILRIFLDIFMADMYPYDMLEDDVQDEIHDEIERVKNSETPKKKRGRKPKENSPKFPKSGRKKISPILSPKRKKTGNEQLLSDLLIIISRLKR